MKELGLVSMMLMAELLDVIVNTLSKAAMKKGMNDFVFIMYSNAFAACLLLLLALFFYRKRTLPPLSCNTLGLFLVVGMLRYLFTSLSYNYNLSFMKEFMVLRVPFFSLCLASCSCINQSIKFFGIGYSSPTLASALSDLVPAFTFILAVIFRMEKLDWKANSTLAKSIGTVVSIAGALLLSLYKGQAIINNNPPFKLFPQKLVSSMQFDWVFGALLLAAHSCFLSINYILLTRIVREYPAELVVVLSRIALTSILSVPAALISVKDLKALRLGFNMELIAIGCSAIFVLSFRGVIHIWIMGKRGPVYVAMFKPLEIVFAVILGVTFLGDSLYIGSVIGAAIIVVGFYAVIWGKSQEKVEEDCTVCSSESYDNEVPLLQNKRTGE
ncbi:WAT1-related protein At3g28050-like isoform X1 [Glycine soja]|uniref:WAT1-related protein isoform B n=1 Tax=Glycine soja TaxID=3848 RepID=A0A445L4N2_GLYSO|nr:WAT1-related protein At3g28050-like isoform X1 [Glycine soja]RZC18109.1 WAT1-related protein isoform B [Glycine soja]